MSEPSQMSEKTWKKLALWLLDCEAATTQYLISLKSASKFEVRRHRHICAEAVKMLQSGGQERPRALWLRDTNMERIVARAASVTEEKR